ncbi:hydrophobin [Metarhizium rileyi]|uniref:Hydrophobin n=2 Tax=Metarhizium rileyi (strain RCEF 4871) TaxID=1649241 RepID=K7NX97_METRR|nr:hydrophobin [Metarhizium rileyi]OAA36067.1 hydrophobin [Metarhizium rileyi RCEF 4871]TWU72956.1 hypothetical protein ED733_003303 [Metarhizium rileyi]
MAFFKVLVAAATLATALALPSGGSGNGNGNGHGHSVGDAAAQCGNHQQLSCCNKGNSAGTLLDGLLGGNCSPLDLSIIGVGVPLSTACSNQVACCTGDQNGLLNLACTNLNL